MAIKEELAMIDEVVESVDKEPKKKSPKVDKPLYQKEEVYVPKNINTKKGSFKLDPKKYKEIEKYDEKIAVRQMNKRGQIIVEQTPTGRVLDREVFSKKFVSDYGAGAKDKVAELHKAKCHFRAAEYFDISVDHLIKGYKILSGKKIDGFWVTDLIDRFGISDGIQMSREELRKLYKKPNKHTVDIAQEKLRDILNTADIESAYVDLVKDIKEEFARDLKEKVLYGEGGA